MSKNPIATAMQLAPIVERVHGAHHPELTRVRELTAAIHDAAPGSDVETLFRELCAVTGNYAIPDDVCEAFEATYGALAEADAAHVGG